MNRPSWFGKSRAAEHRNAAPENGNDDLPEFKKMLDDSKEATRKMWNKLKSFQEGGPSILDGVEKVTPYNRIWARFLQKNPEFQDRAPEADWSNQSWFKDV